MHVRIHEALIRSLNENVLSNIFVVVVVDLEVAVVVEVWRQTEATKLWVESEHVHVGLVASESVDILVLEEGLLVKRVEGLLVVSILTLVHLVDGLLGLEELLFNILLNSWLAELRVKVGTKLFAWLYRGVSRLICHNHDVRVNRGVCCISHQFFRLEDLLNLFGLFLLFVDLFQNFLECFAFVFFNCLT